MGGTELEEQREKAAATFLHSIDGGDAGTTVSVDELDVHLHAVLSGVRVWDWVRHGLGLAQYAEAFRNHSITPLDFPMLVQDDGRVLAEELGVSSSFHRLKLVRAIRRQIMGLGAPPSEPQLLSCEAGPGSGAVAVRWAAPADAGRPPLHRYVLERAGPAGQWLTVAELDDPHPPAALLEEAAAMTGTGGGSGCGEAACAASARVVYRVAAWNLYGRSPYGTAECTVEMPPPGYPGATAGGTVVAALAPADAAAAVVIAGARSRDMLGGPEEGQPSALAARTGDAAPAMEALYPAAGSAVAAAAFAGQGRASVEGKAAAQGWNSLLLLVLPWLLRLVPPAVLQAIAAYVQRLLLRAYGAARLRPPGWLRPTPLAAVVDATAGASPAVPSLSPLHPLYTASGASASTTAAVALRADTGTPHAGIMAAVRPNGGPLVRQRSAWNEVAASSGQEITPVTTAVAAPVPRRGGLPMGPAASGVLSDGSVLFAVGSPVDASVRGGEGPHDGGEGSRHGGRGSAGRLSLLARMQLLPPAAAAAAVGAVTAGNKSPPVARPPVPPASQAQAIPQQRRGASGAPFHRCGSEGEIEPGHAQGQGQAGPWVDSPQLRSHPAGYAPGAAAQPAYHHVGSAPALAGGMSSSLPGSPAHRGVSYAGGRAGGSGLGAGGAGARHSHMYGVTHNHGHAAKHHHSHTGSADQAWYSDGAGGTGAEADVGLVGWTDAEAEAELLAAAAAARVSGRDRDKVCAIPGCGRKLDLLHYREYARRHYCGRCQQTVCGAHTAYSPHGATGSCGHESRCVCVICFTHFNPAYQRFLHQRNTLKPSPAAGAGAGSAGSAGSAADASAQQRLGGGLQAQPSSREFGDAAAGGKSSSKLLWERAATKLKAVTRFRKKGDKEAAVAPARGPPSMETVVE